MTTLRGTTRALPSVEYLRECFIYDQKTGVLKWRRRPREHFVAEREWRRWNARYADKSAGLIDDRGYCRVRLDRCRYKAHRLIWKLMSGEEPMETIDHIDDRRNIWNNLRGATQKQQVYNSYKRKNNSTGYRGVRLRGMKSWWAYIKINSVLHRFGPFDTAVEASVIYEAKARISHGEFYKDQS